MNNFVRGVIDGALSTLGVLIGASAGETSIIISAGLGGTIANGVSNLLGAFSAEKAKEHEQLREVEKAMVRKDLKNSVLEEKVGEDVKKAGIVDGVSTILGGLVPIIPYAFLPSSVAMLLAVFLVLLILSVLGLYIGKISKENLLFSATKMVVLGVAIALIAYGVQTVFTP